jgi:hypothetical protein
MQQQGPVLQAFIPLEPVYDEDVYGFSELLPEAVPDFPMRENIADIGVFLEGREIGKLSAKMFTLTKIAAGDQLHLTRGQGRSEHVQQFPVDGLLLHVRLPVALGMVARQLAATSGAGASIGYEPTRGKWATSNKLGAGFRERVFQCDRTRLTGLYLTSKNADPGSSVTFIN